MSTPTLVTRLRSSLCLTAAVLAVVGLVTPAAQAAAWVAVGTLGIAQPGEPALGSAPAGVAMTVDVLLRRAGPLPAAPPLGVRYTPLQAAARVGPSAAQYDSVANYLAGAGVAITRRYTDRLMLKATGTMAALERAFGVTIDRYAGGASGAVYAPVGAARLPATLAANVAGVVGLGTNGWPTPSPLQQIPSLTSSASAPSANAAGKVQDSQQAQLDAATFLSGFTVTGPADMQAGLESTYHVTLTGTDGKPLAGYLVRPVVPTAMLADAGPTGPNSMVTNAQGQASFWFLTGTPASFTMTVVAAPNPSAPAAAATTSSGAPPPPPTPTPVYATQTPLAVTVSGPAASLLPYTAAQVNQAYNVQPLLNQGANGHGVSVGIVIWNSFSLSDVQSYFALNGGPAPQVTVVPVDGTPQAGGGGTEATLDVERVGGTAPGAHIYVYDAATSAGVFDALINALQANTVQILSMSWGIGESYVPNSFFNPFETLFDAAAQQGITCIASSGDTGSKADGVHTGVNVPASSPYVLAVGGTEMALNADGVGIAAQAAWSPDGSFPLGGGRSAPSSSGGGFSRYYVRPSWQVAAGLAPFWSEPFRGVPDVALAATYPGYLTVLGGQHLAYGGTSASAPTWAGFVADIESDIGASLGAEVAPLLYAFADGAAPGTLFPVTSGNNGGYQAGPGWSPVTGLGTPDVAALDQAFRAALTPGYLVALPVSTGQTSAVGQSVTIQAAVLDQLGLPLAGVPVTASAPQYAGISPGNTATDNAGIATFSVRAQAPGGYTFAFGVPAHNGPDSLGTALTAQASVHWQAVPAPPVAKARTRPVPIKGQSARDDRNRTT